MSGLVAIVGSVTPPGRLARAAQAAVDHASARSDAAAQLFDLGELQLPFADGRSPGDIGGDTQRIATAVSEASSVLLASPTYRASYTGALKNFLDLLPVDALQGKPTGILAMGASSHHFLGVDWQLRPVLGWFGALVPPTSVYLESADFHEGALGDHARGDVEALVDALLAMARGETHPGPTPFAARH